MEQNNPQEISYSKAITELENIVREMQSDNCSIDNLNQYTKRALELLKICKAKLLTTDTQLQKILAELDN